MPVAAPVEPLDPQVVEACGEDPRTVCESVLDWTDNTTLAKLATWFIDLPLTILLILAVAWVAARYARRGVRRAVYRIAATNREQAAWALQKLTPGVDEPPVPQEDPRQVARATSISTVVASTISVIIWVIALMLVLGELGVDLAPLIAGAGIAGVALGFGAQSLVKDCLTGLFMLIEDQYGVGDVVDLGEASGSVERITLRATVLRGQDGTVWHVPNGEIVRVGNRSQLWSVAVIDVVVGYDADLARASRVIELTAKELTESEAYAGDVLEAPVLLGVEAASTDGVRLRLTVKTSPGGQFRIQRALREAIKAALDQAGIAMPPPRPTWNAEPPP